MKWTYYVRIWRCFFVPTTYVHLPIKAVDFLRRGTRQRVLEDCVKPFDRFQTFHGTSSCDSKARSNQKCYRAPSSGIKDDQGNSFMTGSNSACFLRFPETRNTKLQEIFKDVKGSSTGLSVCKICGLFVDGQWLQNVSETLLCGSPSFSFAVLGIPADLSVPGA